MHVCEFLGSNFSSMHLKKERFSYLQTRECRFHSNECRSWMKKPRVLRTFSCLFDYFQEGYNFSFVGL